MAIKTNWILSHLNSSFWKLIGKNNKVFCFVKSSSKQFEEVNTHIFTY